LLEKQKEIWKQKGKEILFLFVLLQQKSRKSKKNYQEMMQKLHFNSLFCQFFPATSETVIETVLFQKSDSSIFVRLDVAQEAFKMSI
jgi:hypothetical protein